MRLGRKPRPVPPAVELDPDLAQAEQLLSGAQDRLRRLRARVDAVQAQERGMERGR